MEILYLPFTSHVGEVMLASPFCAKAERNSKKMRRLSICDVHVEWLYLRVLAGINRHALLPEAAGIDGRQSEKRYRNSATSSSLAVLPGNEKRWP
jgi:hypothetical protein